MLALGPCRDCGVCGEAKGEARRYHRTPCGTYGAGGEMTVIERYTEWCRYFFALAPDGASRA
jgi:hypothetical protein